MQDIQPPINRCLASACVRLSRIFRMISSISASARSRPSTVCFRLRARARRELRSPTNHVDTMSYELGQHFLQSEFSRLSINECQEDNREGRLQWRKLIKLIENHIGIRVTFQLNDQPNRFLQIAFIANAGDSFDLIAVDQISDFLNHPVSGLLVWNLRNENSGPVTFLTLPSCSGPSGQWYSVLFGSHARFPSDRR